MMRIHHIGYLVKNIDEAKTVFLGLGYTERQGVTYDKHRDIFILFMEKDGYIIELVSPGSTESVVSNLIKKYKNSPYHICYYSDDFEQDVHNLEASGFMMFDQPAPAPAINNCQVCFLISPQIGLVEILKTDQTLKNK